MTARGLKEATAFDASVVYCKKLFWFLPLVGSMKNEHFLHFLSLSFSHSFSFSLSLSLSLSLFLSLSISLTLSLSLFLSFFDLQKYFFKYHERRLSTEKRLTIIIFFAQLYKAFWMKHQIPRFPQLCSFENKRV